MTIFLCLDTSLTLFFHFPLYALGWTFYCEMVQSSLTKHCILLRYTQVFLSMSLFVSLAIGLSLEWATPCIPTWYAPYTFLSNMPWYILKNSSMTFPRDAGVSHGWQCSLITVQILLIHRCLYFLHSFVNLAHAQ